MSDFERIKQALPILATITRLTDLKKKGGHLERCPLCDHKDCFSVMEDRQAFKCHSCGEGGDIFNFLGLYENLDSRDALSRAAELSNIELSKPSPKKTPKNLSTTEKIFIVAVEYYQSQVMKHGGREYLIETRHHSSETLNRHKVGMATGDLHEYLAKKGYSTEQMVESGLVKEKEGRVWDYWQKGLSVWPVLGPQGQIISLTMKDPTGKAHHGFLPGSQTGWFLNEVALSKFSEIFIVEGQNDGASLSDLSIHNWIASCGQPSQKQVQALRNNGAKKVFYLWFDQDLDKDPRKNEGGVGHTRRVYQSLKEQEFNVKILRYPTEAKDPDIFIQGLRMAGSDVRATIRKMKEEALDPLMWEITLLKRLPTRDERLKALESSGVFKEINLLPDISQEAYIEAVCELGFSEKAVRGKLDMDVTLLQEIREYYDRRDGKAAAIELAELCFKWFSKRGRFFKTQDGKVWLLFRQTIFQLSDNLPFRSLMAKLTRMSIKEKPGKQIFDFLQTLCFDRGELIEVVSWIHTNRETDTIYVNFNSTKSEIIKIAPGLPPEPIPNGTNREGVLLSSSGEIKPFEFQRNPDLSRGIGALKNLVFEHLTCQKEMRYFVICWAISFLLVDFNKNRALLHCTGATASGKSTAVSFLSYLIYGQDMVGQSSAASSFSEGANSPLVIQDNIENRDLTKQMVNFLLLGANTATKKKRKAGTDSEVVTEKVKAMIVMTSIEPIPGAFPELINRTFNAIFEHRYHKSGFVEDNASRAIVKSRNLILSSIMHILSFEVLPKLEKRAEWLRYIQKEFPSHNKKRANEFIALLMVILEAILPYMPYYDKNGVAGDEPVDVQARDILKRWIAYQDSLADETAMTSNTILNLLDGLAKEVYADMRFKDLEAVPHRYYGENVFIFRPKEYVIDFIKTFEREPTLEERMEEDPDEPSGSVRYFEFMTTSDSLHRVFNRYCKNNGMRNDLMNASALGSRISNDMRLLKRGGWNVIKSEGKGNYFKIIRGVRYWKFSKRLDQIER